MSGSADIFKKHFEQQRKSESEFKADKELERNSHRANIEAAKKGWFERHPKTYIITSAILGGFAWHLIQKYLL